MAYRRRQVIAERLEGSGTLVSYGGATEIAAIVPSLGALTQATETNTSTDHTLDYAAEYLEKVVDASGFWSNSPYTIGYHCEYDSATQSVKWNSKPINPPKIISASATGATTRRIALVVEDRHGNMTPPGISTEVTMDNVVTVTAEIPKYCADPTSSDTWALAYYDDGSEEWKLADLSEATVTVTVSGDTVEITFDGVSFNPSSDPSAPTTNSTSADPNGDYEVTYYYRGNPPAEPKVYYSMAAVYRDHGVGSMAANVARLIFKQGATHLTIIAPVDADGAPSTSEAAYLDAYEKIKGLDNIRVFFIITPDGASQYLIEQGIATAEWCSQDAVGKDRLFIYGAPSGKPIGSPTDSGTSSLFGYLNMSGHSSYAVFAVLDKQDANPIYYENWEDTDGSLTDKEVNGDWVAAVVAGRLASLPDTSTPLLNKRVYGLRSGSTDGLLYWTEEEKDLLEQHGTLIIENHLGYYRVRAGITTVDIAAGGLIEDSEISVRLSEFELRQRARDTFERFRGNKYTPKVARAIQRAAKSLLSAAIRDEVIRDYDESSLEVSQDPTDPTWIIVSVAIDWIYPINGVIFRYSFPIA